jgi:peptide/nickel transport system ATP-binding protein
VSFTIRRGETFGLVGESGCGKSTLGRLLSALANPTAGSVRLDGDELLKLTRRDLRRRRRDLQFVFQDPYAALNPRMRAGAILREPLIVQGVGNRREQWAAVASLLDEVGLSAKAAGLYPHEFSGGQRQRVGLARALTLSPRFIVADEPTSSLDVSIQSQVLNLMKALQERHELTYLVISHDLALLRYLSDTIGVMYLGKLVELGPARRIYEAPAHPYTRGLIDAIPVPDPALERAKGGPSIRGELPSAVTPPSGCRFRTRCPLAADLCAEEEPPLRVFGSRHVAACHFPLQPLTDAAPPAGTAATDVAGAQMGAVQ